MFPHPSQPPANLPANQGRSGILFPNGMLLPQARSIEQSSSRTPIIGMMLPQARSTEKFSTPDPIILNPFGISPDTVIQVFDQVFHCQSMALKLHSAHFRKFFDSADKKPSIASAAFRYQWTTKLDDQDVFNWFLIEASSAPDIEETIKKFKGDKKIAVNAMEVLLRAIHSMSVTCSGVVLVEATAYADYYCSLPALSTAAYGVLSQNLKLAETIAHDPVRYLEVAYKLRHPILFRQAVLQAINPWHNPRHVDIRDEHLKFAATYCHYKLHQKVMRVRDKLLVHLTTMPADKLQRFREAEMEEIRKASWPAGDKSILNLPLLYRNLSYRRDYDVEPRIKMILDELLDNKLPLAKLRDARYSSDSFVCLEIEDADLPWNREQQNW
ncbi:hypothetical protein G7Y89_g14777 [Cudoniella acicularis]|uniref:BTB domain-containing protein n=1 Tax=Cudoniella acicularis TaxID=354080 RepID=A0A8H4QYL8_9HELO|nr:hypothetical protein G7Y89_g14777 [Cudoniella acicularis]